MVRQGDIIKLDFSPQKGHEQAGFRPAAVISSDLAHKVTNMALVCPITNTAPRRHPLHVRLDGRTETSGEIMCEQARAVDLSARPFQFVERLPADLLWEAADVLQGIVDVPQGGG